MLPEQFQCDKYYFTSEAMLRRYGLANWAGCDSRIISFAAEFVLEARRQMVPLYVHTAYRSPATQIKLVKRGVSRAGPLKAPHCHGMAVDIVHADAHWHLPPALWANLGEVGKATAARLGIDVEWGGDWRFWDPAHWQLKAFDRVKGGQPDDYSSVSRVELTPSAIHALKLGCD